MIQSLLLRFHKAPPLVLLLPTDCHRNHALLLLLYHATLRKTDLSNNITSVYSADLNKLRSDIHTLPILEKDSLSFTTNLSTLEWVSNGLSSSPLTF